MKRRALAVTAALLAVLLAPPRGVADDLPTEGKLTISGYDADAMRSDDHRSLAVSESYFYNNSGSEPFSGNITIWVSRGAHIATGLCGSVTNRVVRLEATKIACYDLETVAEGVFKIRPFEAGQFLSYYGERHALLLNVTSLNASASGQLRFNATIGPAGASAGDVAVGNVTVQAANTELGAKASLTWGPPRNLSFAQTMTIENLGGQPEDVDLGVQGVPVGWTAAVRKAGLPVSRVSLPAGENLTLTLNVSAPSHILHVFLEYTVPGVDLPSGNHVVTLEKVFPYNTTYALLFLYALQNDVVTAAGGLETHSERVWNASSERFRYTVIGYDLPASSRPTVTVTWVPPPFVVPSWAIAALAVLGAALVAYAAWQRRPRKKEATEEEEGKPPSRPTAGPPMSAAELRERRDTLRKTLERLAVDRQEGRLPQDLHANMEAEAQAKLTEVERRLDLLTTAEARKRQMLRALRRLQQDVTEGKVDKEVYASLKEKYEQEAMKAMRQIDAAKGVAPGPEGADDSE